MDDMDPMANKAQNSITTLEIHMKRLLVILAAAVAIGGLALTVPALASAETTTDSAATTSDTGAMAAEDCVKYLQGQGYVIGPKVKDACKTGVKDRPACHKKLTTIGVASGHAKTACNRA